MISTEVRRTWHECSFQINIRSVFFFLSAMVNVEGVKIILEFENMRNIFCQISRKLFDTSFVLILNLITYTILQKDHLFKQYVRPYFSRVFPTKLVNKFS